MGRFVNPDNSAFQTALNSEIYVDKTSLIAYTNKVMGSLQAYICNSRPRRFGKSITADMLTAYYSKGCSSEKMFQGLDIENDESFRGHLNKYDVIHVDVQWCITPASGADNVVDFIQEAVVDELRSIYKDILPTDISSVSEALSLINEKVGSRFVIIFDEWDVLIRDEACNQSIQDRYIEFLRGLFKGSEPTKYIGLAYLTGILPIKRLKTQSALNNFNEYSMISAGPMAPYVGFTETEVQKLCRQYDRKFEDVRRWYDGYQLGEYHVYNPRAVVSVMLYGEYQSYWSRTGTYESIIQFIDMDFDGLKKAIISMLSGDEVQVRTGSFQNDMISFKNKDDVLTLLIHLGYLAFDQRKQTAYIPNEEIRGEFATAVDGDKWSELFEFEKRSMELLDATLDRDEAVVAAGIEKIHMNYASAIQYNNENSLSSVLTIAYLSAMQYYFRPVREFPTGRGFADFVFIPKTEYVGNYPALVIELKWNRSAQTAIEQIKEKKYPDGLLQYTGDILLVGISYDKKSKEHQCRIEEVDKL